MNETNFLETLLDDAAVEWKPLGDIAEIYGGLTGKAKADFGNGNTNYIPYNNIFNNIDVDFDKLESVNVSSTENQNLVKYGDILFTGSSENAEEVGISSAVTHKYDKSVYLNSFSFGVRFNVAICLIPEFSKYLFRSHLMRKEIVKTASGVTRFNVSKARFKKILVPIPCPDNPEKSLAIQAEIVRILDAFTELTAELTAELTLRKKQYQYYRDKLLGFSAEYRHPFLEKLLDGAGVEWLALGEVSEKIYSGGTPNTKISEYWENGNVPWMSSGEVNLKTIQKTEKYISETGLKNSSAKIVPKDSVVIALAGQGKTRGKVARTLIELTTNQSLAAITFDKNQTNFDYIFHFLEMQYENLRQISSGNSGRGGLNLKMISSYLVPIPCPDNPEKSLAIQAEIVRILDKFDTLASSITEGLPREIELRQKQYGYYRNLLLKFPKPEEAMA